MNKFFFACISAMVLVNAAQAREVAFCEGNGFTIQTLSATKVACAKTERVLVDVGPRKCGPGGSRVAAEASDGGDLCQGTGIASLAALPALDCKLSYGSDARNNLVRNNPDRCQKLQSQTQSGSIGTRVE
ncbi:MAG: hypothetical protein ACOYNF_09220 [Rhodoferax sp.]